MGTKHLNHNIKANISHDGTAFAGSNEFVHAASKILC